MIREFEKILEENQFNHLKTNIAQLSINYIIRDEKVYVLNLFDLVTPNDTNYLLSKINIYNVQMQIQESFLQQNYKVVDFMSIFFTKEVEMVRGISLEDNSYWIVDTKYDRLIIYENQPSDYLFLRQTLEGLLEETAIHRKSKTRQKTKYFSPVNTLIVLINVAVFIALEIGGNTQDAYYMLNNGAMFGPLIATNGEYYRLFTSMFLHFGVNHLTGNMVSLLFLGDNLERAMGKIRYFLLYLVSGLGASFCSFMYNYIKGEVVVAAGASGAVFGVIGALFYTLIKNKGRLEDLTSVRLGILIVYILYSGFMSPGIDNAAHIGGLLIGFLIAIPLYPKKRTKHRRKEMERVV